MVKIIASIIIVIVFVTFLYFLYKANKEYQTRYEKREQEKCDSLKRIADALSEINCTEKEEDYERKG